MNTWFPILGITATCFLFSLLIVAIAHREEKRKWQSVSVKPEEPPIVGRLLRKIDEQQKRLELVWQKQCPRCLALRSADYCANCGYYMKPKPLAESVREVNQVEVGEIVSGIDVVTLHKQLGLEHFGCEGSKLLDEDPRVLRIGFIERKSLHE